MRSALFIFFLSLGLLIGTTAASDEAFSAPAAAANGEGQSGASAAPSLTSDELRQLLTVLQDPQERERLIGTIQSLQKVLQVTGAPAAPASNAPKVAAATSGGSSPSAQTPSVAAKPAVGLEPNSLGADLLSQADRILDQTDTILVATLSAVTSYRQFGAWAEGIAHDPTVLETVLGTVWRLVAVLILALLVEYGVWHFTGRLYRRLGTDSASAEAEAKTEAQLPASASEQPSILTETEALAAEHSVETDGQAAVPTSSASPEASPRPSQPAAGAEKEQYVSAAVVQPEPAQPRPFYSGWLLLRRLPYILLAAAVDAIPPVAFLGAALLLLSTPLVSDRLMRLMIGAVVSAYVLCRLLLVVARGTFCAPSSRLRLIHISDDSAAFLATWSRRLAIVVILGFSTVQIGRLSGMQVGLQHGIGRIFGLVFHVMLIIMVLNRRREVAAWLEGRPGGRMTTWRHFRARLAGVWHWQAIVIITLVWIAYATKMTSDAVHPLRFVLLTVGVLILFRVLHIVAFGAVERVFSIAPDRTDARYAMLLARARRYHQALRILVNTVMFILLVVVLLQVWGLHALTWLEMSGLGGQIIRSAGTVVVTLVVAVMVWETINFVMQIYMDELTQQGAYVRAARLRTVLPLLRNALLIALLVFFVLTVLSVIGVNVGPLLAGASILGVALGFGSQKLVQDLINGIFLLLENAMQVGDWVTAGGLSGTVETLSIRTLRLRAGDGSVHIIPFSSVTTVTNTNRGVGNAAVAVTISYEEDPDRAAEILKGIVLALRQEDAFKEGMLSDLQYWGVDKIDGTTATLVGQVVCTDSARWSVQRELNRRIKIAFQEQGIRIIPSATIVAFQHPLDIRVSPPEPPQKSPA